MKVLAIGNSFSTDATRYLNQISRADGENLKTVNLYIGGCPLFRHYVNIHNDAPEYDFEFNGEHTGIKVSIKQALQSDEWDVVTLQQVSHKSVDYDTYEPYLTELFNYVKLHAPKAKIMLHQTWAYEEGSKRLTEELGYAHQTDMFNDIKDAYNKAARSLGVGIIPCGEAFQNLINAGIEHIHRDTFHASFGLGRLTLGYVWYMALTGRDPRKNTFGDFDEPVSQKEREAAAECAYKAVMKYV